MKAITLLIITFVILFAGYVFYGKYLEKIWKINPERKTPAEAFRDEHDYIPTSAPVLFGHHFASIAGAGPINGPIQAAVFGWLPVVLWIIIGGIFFGAVQDFSSLFASIRNGGKSIAYITEKSIGKQVKQLFYIFALFTLIFLNASFIDMVATSFCGYNAQGVKLAENASSGSSSVFFIIISILYGFVFHKNKNNLVFLLITGAIFIFVCVVLGIKFPLYLNKTVWITILIAYIYTASIMPVWILLQPRDFLNSCLLYAMFLFAIIGIFIKNPQMELVAFTGFNVSGESLFPMLFITVSCGAISGFHSLVCSGTTAKQIKSESNIKMLGFGAMIIECIIAVIALIIAGAFFSRSTIYHYAPFIIFSSGVSALFSNTYVDSGIVYILSMLAISTFTLTTLDTTTRLARYLIQEFSADIDNERLKKKIQNQNVATLFTVALSGVLAFGGYKNIWALFGTVNQLLAAIALLTVSVWLGSKGKKNIMLIIPMSFMLIAAISSLILLLYNNLVKLVGGIGELFKEGIQAVLIVFLIFFAFKLSVSCLRLLLEFRYKRKKVERKYDR